MEIVINSRVSNEIRSPSPFARTWRICAVPRGCCRTQRSASCRHPAHAAADFLGQRLHGAAAPRASTARCEEQRDAASCRRSRSPMWEPCSHRSRTRGARCLLRRPETPQSNFPGPAAERRAASLALLHAPPPACQLFCNSSAGIRPSQSGLRANGSEEKQKQLRRASRHGAVPRARCRQSSEPSRARHMALLTASSGAGRGRASCARSCRLLSIPSPHGHDAAVSFVPREWGGNGAELVGGEAKPGLGAWWGTKRLQASHTGSAAVLTSPSFA